MIAIAGVSKTYGTGMQAIPALQDIHLAIAPGEFVCLLGPSGCGKSSLLNIVAGFVKADAGQVLLDGKAVTKPGPDRGMVFQEYALFPWMTVEENVAFGLEIRGARPQDITPRVGSLLRSLGLAEFRKRYPKDLSGGLRQRVAIARIMALNPPVMLMDEPFGALDALTRRTLQDEMLRIWDASRKSVLFVTHSIEEALYLGTRVVVMTFRPGRIKRDIHIELPRPRNTSGRAFNELKREIEVLVMDEQARYSEAERLGRPG